MAKIKSIQLYRFKAFEHFTVSCRNANVLTGPNNAGKSTVLDALRIANDVIKYARRNKATLTDCGSHGVCASYAIPHSMISVALQNIVFNYGDDAADIVIQLENNSILRISLHPNNHVSAYYTSDSPASREVSHFKRAFPIDLVIVPTLSALESQEPYLSNETVSRNENTRLASRNFRNIVYRLSDEQFAALQSLCVQGFHDITLRKPTRSGYGAESFLTMLFEENRKPREAFWAGFGFQVWMQTCLQLLRNNENSILVLDEPDIYLHADLQRKLLRIVMNRFRQIFIATHSVEIINESDAGSILYVDNKKRSAWRVSSDDGFRKVYALLGSTENAEFARLARAKRIVFFEGHDRRLIRKFAKKIHLDNLLDDPLTVYLQTGGFGQWQRVREIAWALENIFSLDIKVAAVFDADYRCDSENERFLQTLEHNTLFATILKRKEIENYALSETSLIRSIQSRASDRQIDVINHELSSLIDEVLDTFRDDVKMRMDSFYTHHHEKYRPEVDRFTLMRESSAIFGSRWSTIDSRLTIVGGKDFLSALNRELQNRYSISVTIKGLIDEMYVEELDANLCDMIRSIDAFFQNN